MNKSITTLILIFCSVNCFAQGQKTISAPGNFEFNTSRNFNHFTLKSDDDFIDGSIEQQTKKTYNSLGLLQTEEYAYNNITREYRYIIKYKHNASSLLIERKIYETLDTNIHTSIYKYTYNSKKLLSSQFDSVGRGRPTVTTEFTYNVKGLLVKQSATRAGAVSTNEFEYNANDSLIARTIDTDGDSIVDIGYYYTFNNNHQKTKEESRANGTVYNAKLFVYNTLNQLIETKIDSDNNGVTDYTENFTYNTLGQVVKSKSVTSATGYLNNITSNSYDLNGNIIQQNISFKDSTEHKVVYYQYPNHTKCAAIGVSLIHQLKVSIPEDGKWKIELCGSSFQNKLALSAIDFCQKEIEEAVDGCTNGDASIEQDLKAGEYYLTVAGKGISDDGTYKLNIENLSTSSAVKVSATELKIYPNPTNSSFKINLPNEITGELKVYNALGKALISQHINSSLNSIDASSLPSGIYMVHIKNGRTLYQSKLIKK